MSPKRVLIVDDAMELGRLLMAALSTLEDKPDVTLVPSAEEAVLEAAHRPVDLMITDIRLPGISGAGIRKFIGHRANLIGALILIPIVFLSAVQSKQGKYLLMGYPFLALLLGGLVRQLPPARTRRLGSLLAVGLIPGALRLLRCGPRRGDRLEGSALVRCITLHGLDQVGN